MPESEVDINNPQMTFRQQLEALLKSGQHSCRDLSQLAHQSEKEIVAHLEHLRRSLRSKGLKIEVDPAICRQCGYTFEKRSRLTKPGKCPACKQTTIEPPLYSISEL